MLNEIKSGLQSAFGWIIEGLIKIADVAVLALPDSPFVLFDRIPPEYYSIINAVNYFIPFYTFVSIMEAWLVAVLVWYAVQSILRWGKTIT